MLRWLPLVLLSFTVLAVSTHRVGASPDEIVQVAETAEAPVSAEMDLEDEEARHLAAAPTEIEGWDRVPAIVTTLCVSCETQVRPPRA